MLRRPAGSPGMIVLVLLAAFAYGLPFAIRSGSSFEEGGRPRGSVRRWVVDRRRVRDVLRIATGRAAARNAGRVTR